MLFPNYNFKELEPQILDYWKSKKILEKKRKKNQKGPKFYFLEGPPYTSGHIHLGHAWNMALKDMLLRYKRMRGYNVWDRMGYDMHGLPTEQKVMAKLNLKDKQDIEKYGLKKFQQECRKFCLEMMEKMNEDFIRIGSTLDFTNPYQPITKEFMEAEWWLIKQVHEKGRLYQGLRTMHWDAATQSAVAKHELEYKQVTDTSIYVKFKHKTKPKTYFVVWTTTPWTIPLNLAVMVNPNLEYVEVSVEGETWILAKDLVERIMEKAGKEKYKIIKTFSGSVLEGQKYVHPLHVEKYLPKELQENPRLFSVLLTTEYVDASAGTGLVHCAPGCGPEDYEVGHLNHIPPFNCVNEKGYFANFGPFTGWKAKTDDKKFIHAIEEADALLAKEAYVHDYPHGERSHEPVIFRTTKQWFFKVEDLKERMLAANQDIYWYPDSGKNAFDSWLQNLRDNSITKQRFWGTPVPIWQCTQTNEHIVIGSLTELEKLSGKKVKEMHLPDIDEITIIKNGKTYQRVPDVLDVWIDAGTTSWNCLGFPKNKKKFEQLFPADFILEGKDQIRGWFNLLMVASFLALDKPSFKKVYMHGFVTDVNGQKMSKSLGNVISPYELIDKHGADVLRYYMSETTAGEDINFSWEECAQKARNVNILWNVHKLLINLAAENKLNPYTLDGKRIHRVMDIEEKYIISKLHSTLKKVTELLDAYRLDETIAPLEDLFLELSRTYIQMVREKSSIGEEEEKEKVIYTLGYVLLETLKMFSVVSPFICEAMYLNLREKFGLKGESITHFSWTSIDTKRINEELERNMLLIQEVIQAGLHAREKAKLGLRWPVKELVIASMNAEVSAAVQQMVPVLQKQMNVKSVSIVEKLPSVKVKIKPEYGKIGPVYGKKSPEIITKLTIDSPETILGHLDRKNVYVFSLHGEEIKISRDMVSIEREVPAPYVASEFKMGIAYLNTERNVELEAEGYAREVMRHIQQLRKEAGFEKVDRIILAIKASTIMKPLLEKFKVEIEEKVGAESMDVSVSQPSRKYPHQGEFSVKQESFSVWFEKK